MDVKVPQWPYWVQLWDASFEAIRRRLAENDGEVALSVLESILQPVGKARRRNPAKPNPAWISPRHVRVIQNYAAGKHLTEIARDEKTSRRTILRILRTIPFRLLEYGGIIDP
jgi:DNA-binding NarL/FixJ family response regulator